MSSANHQSDSYNGAAGLSDQVEAVYDEFLNEAFLTESPWDMSQSEVDYLLKTRGIPVNIDRQRSRIAAFAARPIED
ncbi:hypothetical protein [Paraburkholderia sp. 40]|uniref:hypothetical protein n=1 Tax=Paraburkholderia sp. 40 TaxID=2991059 RepID=UPI003D1ED29E